jgi:hypothetical protein
MAERRALWCGTSDHLRWNREGSGIRMPYMGLWAVRQSEDRYASGQCGDAEYAEEKWFSILWNHPCPGWIRTSGISEDEVKV